MEGETPPVLLLNNSSVHIMYIETKLVDNQVMTVDSAFDVIDTIPVAQSLPSNPDARVYMRVTNVSGTTPALNITVRGIMDFGKTTGTVPFFNNFSIANLTTITVDGNTTEELTNVPRRIQIVTDITGTTPSFTLDMWMTR